MDSFLAAAAARSIDAAKAVDEPILALVCNKCGAVVATERELCCQPVPFRQGAVWSYELDLLNETAHCYSATNPDGSRFDVARFDANTCKRLRFSGVPTADHSWFPPACWRNAQCQSCPQQLGWVFSAADKASVPSFAGIIVTNLVERHVPVSDTLPPSPEALASADVLRQQVDDTAALLLQGVLERAGLLSDEARTVDSPPLTAEEQRLEALMRQSLRPELQHLAGALSAGLRQQGQRDSHRAGSPSMPPSS